MIKLIIKKFKVDEIVIHKEFFIKHSVYTMDETFIIIVLLMR